MPVRTEDFDKAIAEVIGTFDGVEEISAVSSFCTMLNSP